MASNRIYVVREGSRVTKRSFQVMNLIHMLVVFE